MLIHITLTDVIELFILVHLQDNHLITFKFDKHTYSSMNFPDLIIVDQFFLIQFKAKNTYKEANKFLYITSITNSFLSYVSHAIKP